MIWNVTTAPDTMPVSYESLRAHCRIDTDDERLLLLDYIAQATEYAEQKLGMSLVTRTITAKFDKGEALHLPRGPVLDVVSIKDEDGNDVAGRHFRVGNSDRIATQHPGPLTIVYTAGYVSVPADIAGSIRLHAATLYSWREDRTAAAANPVHRLDDFYAARSFNPRVF
ncbi:MAG: head-tail connector protein [Tepidisphaeraceae bacterium]